MKKSKMEKINKNQKWEKSIIPYRLTIIIMILILNYGIGMCQDVECGIEPSPEVLIYFEGEDSRFKRGLHIFNRIQPVLETNEEVTFQIPIVAHILSRNNGTGGISKSTIENSLARVNNHYKEMLMEFHICKVNYINNSSVYNTYLSRLETDEELELGESNSVKGVINVFFIENVFTSWGYFPTMANDWIVMRNSHVINESTFSHELGHYFSLYHTHETFKGVEFVNGTNCETTGDCICDTPADPELGLSKVDANTCEYTESEIDPNGDSYDPQTNNMMSYSQRNCRDFFSEEQKNRIFYAFQNERTQLDIDRNCLTIDLDHDELKKLAELLWKTLRQGTINPQCWVDGCPNPWSKNDPEIYTLFQEGQKLYNLTKVDTNDSDLRIFSMYNFPEEGKIKFERTLIKEFNLRRITKTENFNSTKLSEIGKSKLNNLKIDP